MNIIFIEGLKVDVIIGVYDWERKTRQNIIFDIEMFYQNNNANSNDDIKDAINYQSVCECVIKYVKDTEFQLVETLAEKVCMIILDNFKIQKIKLKLNKGEVITGAKNVGVIIQRTADKSYNG